MADDVGNAVTTADAARSNAAARNTWERLAVGQLRARAPKGSPEYFAQIRAYRYGYETPFIPRLFDFAGMRGKRVLEIGVGNGIDGVEMARAGAVYTGLDITRNHLELARTNFEQHGLNGTFVEGDLLDADVPAGPFDVVYSFGVLHHIAHEEAYLRRIRDLLGSSASRSTRSTASSTPTCSRHGCRARDASASTRGEATSPS